MADMDKTEKMTVTVPGSLLAALRAEAAEQNRNLSNMVTVILKQGLERAKEKAA